MENITRHRSHRAAWSHTNSKLNSRDCARASLMSCREQLHTPAFSIHVLFSSCCTKKNIHTSRGSEPPRLATWGPGTGVIRPTRKCCSWEMQALSGPSLGLLNQNLYLNVSSRSGGILFERHCSSLGFNWTPPVAACGWC